MCLRLCGIPSKKRMIFKSHASVAVSSFPPPPPYPLRLYCHGKEEAERIFELTHKNSFYIQHLFHVHRKTSSISKDCLIFMEISCLQLKSTSKGKSRSRLQKMNRDFDLRTVGQSAMSLGGGIFVLKPPILLVSMDSS